MSALLSIGAPRSFSGSSLTVRAARLAGFPMTRRFRFLVDCRSRRSVRPADRFLVAWRRRLGRCSCYGFAPLASSRACADAACLAGVAGGTSRTGGSWRDLGCVIAGAGGRLFCRETMVPIPGSRSSGGIRREPLPITADVTSFGLPRCGRARVFSWLGSTSSTCALTGSCSLRSTSPRTR